MLILSLLACSRSSPLATVPRATRATELANGELLVGTSSGELWLVTSFGEATRLTDLKVGPVHELVADPIATYWARVGAGDIHSGGIWLAPTRVGADAALLVRGCEDTSWMTAEEAGPGVTALSLAASCDAFIVGTADGHVDGHRVTTAAIRRVQAVDGGSLWVDARGRAGCLGCEAHLPSTGVVDAVSLHLAPFVTGEVLWIDEEGRLWIESG